MFVSLYVWLKPGGLGSSDVENNDKFKILSNLKKQNFTKLRSIPCGSGSSRPKKGKYRYYRIDTRNMEEGVIKDTEYNIGYIYNHEDKNRTREVVILTESL